MRRLLMMCAILGLLVSCQKEMVIDPQLSEHEIALYVGETKQLSYSGKGCEWKSDNILIASVSETGFVEAHLVGEVNIYANNSVCKVIVKPNYTNYIEPYLDFERGLADWQTYMEENGCVPNSEDGMSYMDEQTNTMYVWIAINGNVATGFLTSISKTSILSHYLLERFLFLYESDDVFYYTDATGSVLVGTTYNENYKDEYKWVTIFMPMDQDEVTKGTNPKELENMLNSIKLKY